MTNKLVLRSVEEFLSGFKPTYSPIMTLFMRNAQQYNVEVGQVTFKRAEAIGDLDNHFISPKDTEFHQIHSKESSKVYKKYFFGSQYIQSSLQDTRGYEDVVAQVLNHHNKQNDMLFLTGQGTSNATVVNNGLFYSADANFVDKTAAAAADLNALYTLMTSIVEEANEVEGEKLVLIYGDAVIAQFNSLFAATSIPFSKTIGDALPDVSFAKVPKGLLPSAAKGFLVVNLDQIKTHYSVLPQIEGQGTNEEKKYAWTNFLMGSNMVEVLAHKGIIKQTIS